MHEKEIEKLQAEKEKVERQLAQEEHKIQRLENRAAYYEKGERRKRAHRLITRGAANESVAPRTKVWAKPSFTLLPNRSLHCQTRKGCSRKLSAAMREVIEHRTVSFSCDADQTQRGAICRGCCRLPCWGKAAQ